MSALRQFAYDGTMKINGRIFVDRQLFIDAARELIQQEREDCTEEECNGLDIAMNILHNLK